jgi:twinkle protein
MNKGLGCKWIFLDHVSIVVSGQDGDERKMLDILMTKLRSLVEEVGVGMILVSHLKRPEGRGFEEGRETTLGHLRGSAGLGQLSDMVIGLERNQQDEEVKNETTIRILKNRFSGETGVACTLEYNQHTGRLHEKNTYFDADDTQPITNDNDAGESTESIAFMGGSNEPF